MVVKVSTGGFRTKTATEAARLFNELGIWDIELSAGLYEENCEQKIRQLIAKGNRIEFHNYYPRPKEDFVLNLGSQNEHILVKSRQHVRESIKLASRLKLSYYSIHAGFCIDPSPLSLGKDVGGNYVNSLSKVRDTFLNEIFSLSEFALKHNIQILVENNVTSKTTFQRYNGLNVLLMSDLQETIDLLYDLPSNVGWLCDVAHLKVSANSFGYDPIELIDKYSEFIMGYHLSDNNGLEDTNDCFHDMSWFKQYLKPVDYVSVEVYKPLEVIKECWLEANKMFGYN